MSLCDGEFIILCRSTLIEALPVSGLRPGRADGTSGRFVMRLVGGSGAADGMPELRYGLAGEATCKPSDEA